MDIIKIMKPSKDRDDLDALLNCFFYKSDTGTAMAEYLVSLGANINNRSDGGSRVLQELLMKNRFFFDEPEYYSYTDIVELDDWVQRGARYVPGDKSMEFRHIRNNLCEMPFDTAMRFLRVLARATTADVIEKIVDTPKVRARFGMKPREILEKLRLIPQQGSYKPAK